MEKKGYAIVGVGYFGAELGRILNTLEGAGVKAVLDPENGEAVAAELGCDVEYDLDSLYSRDDIDAVIVATPNYLHEEPVVKAAEHRIHVFCEKPIALSFGACDRMVKVCSENGVIFMAGHVMNFFNGVRTAKRLIQEGRIGEVLYCHAARNGWEEPQPSVSWKKVRSKSGGHLYHHIHELDCIQSIMGTATTATMVGGNVAHVGEQFGDEDDLLLITLEFPEQRFAILEYGSAFRWPEHYVLIQGTKGAIRMDMQDVGMVLKTPQGEEHYLVHDSQEMDEDRTRIYRNSETDGAIMYGDPSKKPPMWLWSIMKKEMEYFNAVVHGGEIEEEFASLFDGTAARAAIATADACTLSLTENRKVHIEEITLK
ncbi:MAG: Gfo/Idh/MocA family protein [Limnochordia bacterium]|jgi:predicted dehydrogenase